MSNDNKQRTSLQVEKAEQIKWVGALMERAQSQDFFGTILVTMKNGSITEVEQAQTFKPPKS